MIGNEKNDEAVFLVEGSCQLLAIQVGMEVDLICLFL